jgi:hypothetical protein
MQHINSIPVEKIEFHRKALLNSQAIHFNQDEPDFRISESELTFLFPAGIKRGEILPIIIAGQSVGLFTVGDFRQINRNYPSELSSLFHSDLANLISLVLTWHKEKRQSAVVKEGARKLTMIQREPRRTPVRVELGPKIRSQINGPLAGILASCEYLKGSNTENKSELGRYISVIERNASKIHEISSGVKGDF